LTDGVPTVDVYSPALQFAHAVHELAFCVVLYWPLMHGVHAWFPVSEPAVDIDSPGWHTVHALHVG
jgi:hypothetical protein